MPNSILLVVPWLLGGLQRDGTYAKWAWVCLVVTLDGVELLANQSVTAGSTG